MLMLGVFLCFCCYFFRGKECAGANIYAIALHVCFFVHILYMLYNLLFQTMYDLPFSTMWSSFVHNSYVAESAN